MLESANKHSWHHHCKCNLSGEAKERQQLAPSSSHRRRCDRCWVPPPPGSRCQRCGARHAERGVVRVSAKGCSVRRGVGGEGDEGKGEKVAAAARGKSGRRLHEGGVLPY
jgi:hypothetical protein